jgi:serine/threonine protein phosphatase PrpC
MPTVSDLPNGRVAAYYNNSCHGEDVYLTRELGHHMALDAVLDGATARGGAQASAYAAEMLREGRIDSVDDLTTLLEMANSQLFQRGRGRFFLTTASVALKIGPTLHVVCVGDSPVFLIRDRDVLPLTVTAKGHTFVGIANALGRQATLACRTTSIDLRPWDRLVLATDGLIENVAPCELVPLLDHAPSPEEAVAALCLLLCEKKRCNRGRVDERSGFKRDDATAIIRYIGPHPRREAAG